MKQVTLKLTIMGVLSILIISGFNSALSRNIEIRNVNDVPQKLNNFKYSSGEERESNNNILINRENKETLFDHSFSDKHDIDKNPFTETKFVPGEFIVKFKQNVVLNDLTLSDESLTLGIPSVDSLNEKNDVISILSISDSPRLSSVFKINVPEDKNIKSIVNEYKNDPNIEYAEPNYIFYNCSVPNDPLYDEQWALSIIDAPEGWDIETGSSDIVIAITDTGVDYTHPDLAANIWNNDGETPDNGIDDDGNGYIDDIRGWDFSNNDNNPFDDHGHGTHCAGIASAVTNNDVGIAGVSWNCRIMPVKGLNKYGSGSSEDLANCIYYAADNGADVISMSWGSSSPSSLIEDALEYAYTKGIFLVAAAGNSDTSRKHYPSGFEKVLSVSATDENDEKASFSNYGYCVDVAAPGVSILSTLPNENYKRYSGTSMACPHVAGLAGLILSKNTCSYKLEMVKTIIKNSVDPVISDCYIGTGRINLHKAMQKEPAVAILDVFPEELDASGEIQITGIAWGETFQKYVLEHGKGKDPESWTEIYNSTETGEGILASLDTTDLEDGLHSIKLSVVCDDATFNDTIRIVVNNEINTFTVDDDGPADFQFIQDAIDNSGHGDSIFVYEGVYEEVIEIKRSINLTSENKETTQINGYIEIFSDNLIITGFTIITPIYDWGITIDTCINVNISNNHIQHCFVGIAIGFSSNVIVYNNIIDNTIYSCYLYRSENNSISQTRINNTDIGLYPAYSYNNTILNNKYDNVSGQDIRFAYSGGNILRNNLMTGSGIYIYGLELRDFKNDVDVSNKLRGKSIYYLVDETDISIPSDPAQLIIVNCSDSNINHIDFNNCSMAILIEYSLNITISNNNFTDCYIGLFVENCDREIKILDNNFLNISYCSVFINCYNVLIEDNEFLESAYGNWIQTSEYTKILNNFYINNTIGLYSVLGNYSIISRNILQNNEKDGFIIKMSKGNILRDNEMINCGITLRSGDGLFFGFCIDDFWHDIDSSNTVNGKTVYYYSNESSIDVPSDAGQLIFVNCSYSDISNLDSGKNLFGVELAYSNNNTVSNCNIGGILLISSRDNLVSFNNINSSNLGIELENCKYNIIRNNTICNGSRNWGNYRGIALFCSDNNIVLNNCLSNNTGFKYSEYLGDNVTFNIIMPGLMVALWTYSSNNLIKNNKIIGGTFAEEHDDIGIFFDRECDGNEVIGNLIQDNYDGVNFWLSNTGCNSNLFYHNIFSNNSGLNARDGGVNYWYNPILKQGNYWDDYDGVDADGDGIGDTPYDIPDGDNQDLYPLGYFRETEPPQVKITKPVNALYLGNIRIRKYLFRNKPLIIGKINITVNATDDESGIKRVEFYIDGQLKENITTPPYAYMWKRDRIKIFGHRHTIKVTAFDNAGNNASEEIKVWKFL